jgi:DNA-binding response OmpR family regulator
LRILLVEDDPRLAKLISSGLSEDGLIVDHAANATVGLNMTELETFDLFILDVMLPEGREAGFDLARAVRNRNDHTPILFLTARADMDSKVTGLETGGDDYLSKPFDFRELHARIRALVRRSKGGSSNVVNLPLGLHLDIGAKELLGGSGVNLTPREYALLECFALNPGRAYSRSALIERVWPEDTAVELKVVDVYVSTVRRKLGEGIIDTVRGTGYRLGKLEPVHQAAGEIR